MAKILPFKTRQQLETEKAVRIMREWEEANWHHAIERETVELGLSQEEIGRLNEWVGEEK